MKFFEKLNIIFINRFPKVSFYKVRTKLHSKITLHHNTYFDVLIKNIRLKTKNAAESTERQKTSFPIEIVEIADLHKPTLNKIMTTRKIRFRSSFNINSNMALSRVRNH